MDAPATVPDHAVASVQYSPDMNIIETIGSDDVQVTCRAPTDHPGAQGWVNLHWAEITPQYLRRLYASLPLRIASLLHNRGYPTKY